MKKYIVLSAGMCLAILFTGCGKSSESAYKRAYEKAQAQAQMQSVDTTNDAVVETPVVTPVQTRPANDTRVVDNVDNETVRQERVSVVNGGGLKDFSVVVGSFSVIANAEGLQRQLNDAGYSAQIVKNDDRNMYRVVASTFESKADAVRSRDELRTKFGGKYADAWLLYKGK